MMRLPFAKALFDYHATQLRQSGATGIFLGCGWVMGVLLTFVLGQFVARNEASLGLLFTYIPWLMAVLIPALLMTVATEGVRGISERLMSLPFTAGQRVGSRFVVYWLLLGIWVLGFVPLAATVIYLGKPDMGPLVLGFVGSWLLAAPLLAMSLFVSSRINSGVAAFLVAASLNLGVLLVGLESVATWFAAVPGLGWLGRVGNAMLLEQFRPFAEGILGVGPMLFMMGMALLFLGLMVVKGRASLLKKGWVFALGLALIVVAVSPLTRFLQADLTEEKVHTPSKASIAFLKSVPGNVVFTVYASENNNDVPAAVHAAVTRLEDVVMGLKARLPEGKIVLKKSNTDQSTSASIAALQAGAEEQILPTGTAYLAAVTAAVNGRQVAMGKIDPEREALMEYDLMRLVAGIGRAGVPVVTVVGEDADVEKHAWLKGLRKTFQVNIVPVGMMTGEVPADTTILLMPDDAPLTEAAVQGVRAYLGQGGNVVLMTEPGQPEEAGTRLSGVLPEWGVQVASDTMVADARHGTQVTTGKGDAVSYPYWLRLGTENLEDSLPFTSGITHVFLPESGEVVEVSETRLTMTPVLMTGKDGKVSSLEMFRTTPAELANGTLAGEGKVRMLGVMLSGTFTDDASRGGNLIVIADRKWLGADVLGQANDNLMLFDNMMNYLGGNGMLTDIRAKGATPRTLVKVEELAQRLNDQSAATEQKIQARLADVNAVAPADANAQAVAQEEAFKLRQSLRDGRQAVRKKLQGLENGLLGLNLLLMPSLTGLYYLWKRRQRRLRAGSTL